MSTKVLLRDFTPSQILFTRFVIGYLTLWAVAPRLIRVKGKKEELYFLAAGLCEVTLYFPMESIALTCTQTSNVGVIVAVSSFFTMFFRVWLLEQTRPGVRFFIGFLIAMTGILCISLEGSQNLALNPKDDLLALGVAIVWALYPTVTRKTNNFEYTTIPITRRTFLYGLLYMLPVIMLSGMELPKAEQLTGLNIANIPSLGLGASAIYFISWNNTVCALDTAQASVYIYAVPVVTTLASVWILRGTVTVVGVLGIVMTVLSLLLPQNHKGERVWGKTENASW